MNRKSVETIIGPRIYLATLLAPISLKTEDRNDYIISVPFVRRIEIALSISVLNCWYLSGHHCTRIRNIYSFCQKDRNSPIKFRVSLLVFVGPPLLKDGIPNSHPGLQSEKNMN